jgi:hypothetical protein
MTGLLLKWIVTGLKKWARKEVEALKGCCFALSTF